MKPLQYDPTMLVSFPSLVIGMPDTVYHSTNSIDFGADRGPLISKSGLDLIARSPAHYKFARPKEQTRDMVLGSAIHSALLTPDLFATQYLLLKDVKDRRAAEYKAAIKSWDRGEDFVLVGWESDYVKGMQEAAYADKHARGGLTLNGYREASLFARDPVTGVGVRVRFDILSTDGVIVDIKKTRDARPDEFRRSIYNYRYHVQAAFYSDVYEWAFGEAPKGFSFLAIEDEMPHAIKVYRPDSEMLAEGRREYRAALNRFAECSAANDWPAYGSEPEFIALPQWVLPRIEAEQEIDTEDGTAH